MEGRPGQHHRYLVRPFRFVAPASRRIIPHMRSTRKANDPIGKLAPHLVAKVQFVGGQHNDIVVDGENRLRLNVLVRIEAMGELVGFGANDVQWFGDFRKNGY